MKEKSSVQAISIKTNGIDEMRLVNFYRDLKSTDNVADKKVAWIGILRIARKIKKGQGL